MAKKYFVTADGNPTKDISTAAGVAFDFTKDGGEKFLIFASQIPGYVAGLGGTALHALLHGVSQKGGDSYAAAKSQPNPLAWAQEQVKETIAAILGGTWNTGRSGDGAARVSILARALHAIKIAAGQESTVQEVQAYLDELEKQEDGKAQIAALKEKKAVKAALARIRLEDAKKRLERAAKAAEGISDEEDEEE